MYWIANFVVPEIVIKDLQRKASEGEEKPEEQTNTFESRNNGAAATNEPPRKKIKKADLKKMIKPR